ncbi:hypothetical protein N7T98_25815 [Pseudomonas syringae pv. tomato]|uniref:hypothetical protein n=1 Tax=Pseudomonas syringae group genomosp. 3 TaxID=251701 RepID=UPI0022A77A09|nr:hypothetical protein [Pseudomonas syringae group genomosp. 3]MCZ0950799.1 hypothetical protein [Pseudomonas syringae pv. tomato]
MFSDETITLTDSEYQEMKTVCDEVEYCKLTGLKGWKRAVMNYLPHDSSVAFANKVQEFLDSITSVE